MPAALTSALALACADPKDSAAPTLTVFQELQDPLLRSLVVAMGAPRPLAVDDTNAWSTNPMAAALGETLFFDRRLSGGGSLSCGDCHRIDQHFTDGQSLPAVGSTQVGVRHTPSVMNAGLQRWQFWDGRCDTLWCQATAPIENPQEMALARADLGRTLAAAPDLWTALVAIDGLPPELRALSPADAPPSALPEALLDTIRFPPGAQPVPSAPESPAHQAWLSMDPVDQDAATRLLVDISKAIAAYEARLISGPAPIDRYAAALEANDPVAADAALSPAAARGLLHFVTDGQCVLCHTGPQLSNLEFESIGLPAAPNLHAEDPAEDAGRYAGARQLLDSPFNAAGRWSEAPDGEAAARLAALRADGSTLGHFKVPGLRDVAQTGPYMHTGQLSDLRAVVEHYVEMDTASASGTASPLLSPLDWSTDDIDDVIAFLHSLSAETPATRAAADDAR